MRPRPAGKHSWKGRKVIDLFAIVAVSDIHSIAVPNEQYKPRNSRH
ncbi:hypothetical protein J3R73_005805 [Labrys monachus]|uniref:Uncharacterized protein n=1 Tax=Labrys monachus TaxID=217067 RepID=A0ABU0FN24_9HYPH|nr:hypothetical protein [Labrys monachus]